MLETYWREIVVLSMPFLICLIALIGILTDKGETGDDL